MNRIRTTAGMVAIAALATAVAASAPANAATASHTQHFTTRTLVSQNAGNRLVETDRVLVAGKSVGFSANQCMFNFSTGLAACDVAVALPAGMLYAHVTVDGETGVSKGVVTGGTLAYKGARGTTVGAPGSRPSDVRITIVYHT